MTDPLPAITVLLVDDHEAFRAAARAELEDGGFEVVAELGEAQSVVATAAALRPDVVLLDIRLPDGDGLELAGELAAAVPATAIVLISTLTECDYRDRLTTSTEVSPPFLPKSRLSASTLRALLAG